MSLQHILPTSAFSIGCTLTVGTLGVTLAVFWAKICRLTLLLQRREQRINRLLTSDRLTALNNRESFFLEGEQILLKQASVFKGASANSTATNGTFNSAKVALLSLHVDSLKAIDSEFGHPVIDELLQQIARRLRACMVSQNISQRSSGSTLARVSANEFALLVAPLFPSEERNAQAIKQFMAQLLAGMHQPFLLQSHTVYVNVRGGLAWATRDSSLTQLLLWANTAANTVKVRPLVASPALKQPVRNPQTGETFAAHYAVFHAAMEAARISQMQLKQSFFRALERQELRVRYQPIVDLSTNQTIGFEALVRWQHPELGLLSPDTFLPLAEEMGLAVAIDRWVFGQVCQQLYQWQEQQLYPSVSINFSGAHLSEPDVADSVRMLLAQYPIDPSQLTVEVTESTMVADQNRAVSTLKQLKQMGLRVSLDDFGTGYCSLTYLSQFPVDILKIDRSFISRVGIREAEADRSCINEAIVQSVLTLADTLGIQVVAEGIEQATQHQWLRQRKCAYGQGNFFSTAITQQSAQIMLRRCSINVA